MVFRQGRHTEREFDRGDTERPDVGLKVVSRLPDPGKGAVRGDQHGGEGVPAEPKRRQGGTDTSGAILPNAYGDRGFDEGGPRGQRQGIVGDCSTGRAHQKGVPTKVCRRDLLSVS